MTVRDETPGGDPAGDSPGAGERHAKAVSDYYDQTWLDYRLLWLNRDNLAVHFGYTDETTRGHTAALKNMNAALADRAAVRAGDRVLDAGCGVGGSSMWLAAERDAEVVGITMVASQLEMANRYAAGRGLADRVRFEQADFTATPFPDASFDVVWTLEALCHAPSKLAFYREAARLLRPGGRVVVGDFIRAGRPLGEVDERLLHEWLDGWAVPDIDSAEEHRAHLAGSGFADVRVEDVTAHTRPSLRRLYRMAHWTFPLAVIGHKLGIRNTVQHKNVIGSVRQYQALRREAWFYGIVTATKPDPG